MAAWPALVVAHVGLVLEIQPIATWFYPVAWWGYIWIVNGLLVRRGEPSLAEGVGGLGFFGLCVASWGFWLFFEALNLRLANWYYVGVPDTLPARWIGISLSFATVIPLLYVTGQACARWCPIGPCRMAPCRVSPAVRRALMGTGVLCLVLPLAWPRQAFALVWGFVIFLLDPVNHRAGRPSLLGDLEQGSVRRLVTLLSSGLVCGMLWEGWNYWAVGKWIYTVPFLTDTKLFEMPVAGFLGFPALAVESFVFCTALTGLWERLRRPARRVIFILTLTLGLSVLAGMERVTIDAHVPCMADVPMLNAGARAALRQAGIAGLRDLARLENAAILRRAAGIDPRTLADARNWARLARLKGMGSANATRLWAAGIHTLEELALGSAVALDQRLSGQVERRKLVVWVRAARREASP